MEKLSPSLTVKRLLPEFISTNYPQFVLFLEKYYEFMEQDTEALGRLRNIETLNDVDEQTDDATLDMVFGPVLKDFPNTIKVDRKFLYKHASEFFRSKGSLESVETLFRILYNEEIRVFLPKEDIIKVSSGNWIKRIAVQIGNVRYSNGDAADALNMIGKEVVQYDPDTGGIVARGVVEDIDFQGTRITLYMAAEKQLREFEGDKPLVAIDSQDPEVEAKVEATIEKGKVASLLVRNGGRDYTRKPDVVFYGGRYNQGKTAQAEAIITNGVLVGFNIQNSGEGYIRSPSVRVVNQIFADVQKNLGKVTITNGGEYYIEGTEITVTTSNGTGERFRIAAVNGGSIESIQVLQEGGDYSENDEIVFDNVPMGNYNLFIAPETYSYSVWDKIGLGIEESVTKFSYTTVDTNGVPLTIKSPRNATRIIPTGSAGIHELYQIVPSRADETYTSSFYVKPEYSVDAVTIVSGGTGYTTAPIVEFIGGNPEISAEATATLSGGVVTGLTITNPGRGYNSTPIVRLNGDGSGALATASIDSEIDQIELIIGVEKPAKAVPVISGGKVFNLNLIDGGGNYTAAPAVTFFGGDGSGATATANITSGVVTGFTFNSSTDGGTGYSNESPTLYFNKINYGRVVFDLKNQTVVSVNNYGAAFGFSGNITPEADGVMRVSISGSIPGLTLNDSVHASLIPCIAGLSDPRVFKLTDETKGLLVFGALFDNSPVVRPYINIPSVSTAIAEIGELGIEEILLEDNSKIAIGDDAFVFEANNGVILGARVLESGSGYQYKPNITINSTSTSGVGATAEAVMGRGGGINEIIVSSVGSGYIGTGIPTDTYRRWQAGMVVYRNQILRYGNNLYIIGGKDTAVTTVAPPTHTNSIPVLFDTSATFTFYGKAATINIPAPDQDGPLYVGSISLSSGGSGYTRPPLVTFSSPTGTGKRPDAYAIISGGSVTSIVLKDGGSGYMEQATVIVAPPDGPGRSAQAIANMTPTTLVAAQATAEPIIDDAGFITGVTVTNAGAGYTTIPTVTITPPQITTGSPPGLVADIQGSSVIGVKITNGGDGYKEAPVLEIDEPASPVLWLELVSGGSGFTSTPTVTITDGSTGQGAVAAATVAGGAITSLTLLSRGSGYTTNPTVTVTGGGGGTGVVITAHINSEIASGATQAVAAVGATFPVTSVNATTNRLVVGTMAASMLRNNDHLVFESTGTLPAPLQPDTYYHIGFLDSTSFSILDEEFGFPIDLTTAGSGSITATGVLIADEILEDPTSTKNILFESNDLIISEENTDRYHLTIPEQNYTYIEPATVYTAEEITFGEKVLVTTPAATVINPLSFTYVSEPDPIVLGQPYDIYLKIMTTTEFVSSLTANQCVIYTDAGALAIPGLVSGTRYYVRDIDTINFGFTLSKEIAGPRITFQGRARSLSVINFNTVIDALFLATGETSQLAVGDVIFLYGEPGSVAPEPLTDKTFYKVQQVSGSGYIKIATLDAPSTAINLSTVGTGSFRILKTTPMASHSFSALGDTWSMALDKITGFADNDVVNYESTGTPAGNLLNDRTYYIHNINALTGEFNLTNEFNGITIDIIDAGTGSHTITKVVSENDRIRFDEADYNRLNAGTEVQYVPLGGVQATGTSSIDSITGAVTSIAVGEDGLNYASVPNVTIVDSDLTRPLGGIVVNTGGTGYTSAPTVTIEGGGGAGATATATIDIDTGTLISIAIDTAGDGYSVPPNVSLTGGGASVQGTAVAYIKPKGSGATAHAVMGTGPNADKVDSIVVDTNGSGYHSAVVNIDAPNTKITPLLTNKAYFLIEPDDNTHSFKITDVNGGVPIKFKTGGTGTHTFVTQSRYLAFDPSLMGDYIDDTNNILYTSIRKTGVLSPFYSESLNLENLDNVLLESSNADKNQLDFVALETATAVELQAEDNSIDTGIGVYFHTNSAVDIGLTAGNFYYVNRVADDIGNGFKFYTTFADSENNENEVQLDKTGVTFLKTDDFFRIVKYDLVSQETGQINSINLLNAGKFYKALPRVHVNVGEGRYGKGVVLNPIGAQIGTIRKIEVINPGYAYTVDNDLVFPLNIHVVQPSKNYIVGERIEINFSEKATCLAWDPHTFLLTVSLDDPDESAGPDDFIDGVTSGAHAYVVEARVAEATANPVALTQFDGYYDGRKNLIDELNIRVQDSRVYQDFSYLIRSSKPFVEYENVLKKLAHPAGMFVSGDVNYSVIATNAGINTVRIASTVTTSEAYSG